MDLLLDSDGDITFINGDCPVTSSVSESLQQRLKIRLTTMLGEWFLDTSVGIDYFGSVLTKVKSKSTVDLIFQSEIVKDDYVDSIETFESTLDSSTRKYSLTFSVKATDGSLTESITIG